MVSDHGYASLASWAYDLDKPVGRSFGDLEFYAERLSGVAGPILEPAAGNGRILVPLAEAGHALWGFDSSPEMLARCRRECQQRRLDPELSVQRFEDFAYDLAFEAIIVPAGSFQLVADVDAARAVLRRFRDALAAGGRLILDLDPLADLQAPPAAARHWRSGDDLLTLVENRAEADFVGQRTVSQLRYEHWRGGRLLAAELQIFALRLWGALEFELALREAGFADVVVSADYRVGAAPTPATRVLSFEATAAGDGGA